MKDPEKETPPLPPPPAWLQPTYHLRDLTTSCEWLRLAPCGRFCFVGGSEGLSGVYQIDLCNGTVTHPVVFGDIACGDAGEGCLVYSEQDSAQVCAVALGGGGGGGGTALFETDCVHAVLSITVTPCARRIVAGTFFDCNVLSSSGVLLRTIASARAVSVAPDERFLVGWSPRSLVFFALETGESEGEIACETPASYFTVFSPDSKQLATTTADHAVVLWDVASRGKVCTMRHHRDFVVDGAFSPCGAFYFSASLDRTICQWESGVCVHAFTGSALFTHAVRVSRCGKAVVCIDDAGVRVIPVPTSANRNPAPIPHCNERGLLPGRCGNCVCA